jgi:putative YphP/YqiW family bacilliredoxin
VRYDPKLVRPMRVELTSIGFQELLSPEDVDGFMAQRTGTALVVVNSVCGCAAGMARPGVNLALQQGPRPERLGTVFAGMDEDAVARARSYFDGYPPSSPSMALFRDGELVHFVPRHQIEGRVAVDVANDLIKALEEHCAPAA